jgi:flagellar biosynthesis/type III secretory pathway M-ring protein FliF/YscJ
MDLFKAQFEKIQRQLAGLSASQKMLTGTLVAIMVMTLLWWGHYAADPEMEPLLSQSASLEELAKAKAALATAGINATLTNNQLMVASDMKLQAYSTLAYAHAVPNEGKDSFDEIFKSINPLQSQDTTDHMLNHARELTASQIIGHFPKVASAKVTIDNEREVRIGGRIDPTAGAYIQTDGPLSAENSASLVEAAAAVLQSSLAGITRSNIRVIVNGRSCPVKDPDSDDLLGEGPQALAHKEEDFLEQKIQRQLHYIDGVIPTVTVQVNASRVEENKTEYDPSKTVSKEESIKTTSEETTSAASAPTEAGAQPNTGFSSQPAASSGGGGAGTTREQSETKMANRFGEKQTVTHTPAGSTTVMAAVVKVPLSYFQMVYRTQNPTESEPLNELKMKDVIVAEEKKIRDGIAGATGLPQDDKRIYVDSYTAAPAMMAAGSGAAAGAASSAAMRYLTPRHIREGVLGVMAMASLFMVSSLVKKGTPATVGGGSAMNGLANLANVGGSASAGATPSGLALLHGGELPAGEAAAADPSLDGMELDEEAIRAQQMMEQVSTMVKENPDNAAALVKRWLNRG